MFLFLILLAVEAFASPSINKSSRIVGGLSAEKSEVPYIVSITANSFHMCGGSILNKQTIVTAAHCLEDWTPLELQVHAGARTHAKDEGQWVNVSAIQSHRLFNPETMDYDVGLLRLAHNLTFSENVQSIKLSEKETLKVNKATVAGWGYLTAAGHEAETLNLAEVPIVEHDLCNHMMDGKLTKRMLCAGYLQGGIDACQKDSGGPLVARKRLIGIVSWGDGCGTPNKPGVYTHIGLLWRSIKKFMEKKYKEKI